MVKSRKPSYLAERLKVKEEGLNLRGCKGCVEIKKHSISIGREGFLLQGGALYNKLDEKLRSEKEIDKFKSRVKKWVKTNIDAKPKSKIPVFKSRLRQSFTQSERRRTSTSCSPTL